MNIATQPEIRAEGDPAIVLELELIRLTERLLGGLPAFRRGLMFYDFDTAKVRVVSESGAA